MSIIRILITSFSLTIIIEFIGAYLLKVRQIFDYVNIFLVNVITNPLVVFISFFINIRYGLYYRNLIIIPLEIMAVVVEGYYYKKYLDYKKINGFLLSLILNISSYVLGIILNMIIY